MSDNVKSTSMQIGAKQAMLTTILVLIVVELFWLFIETRGDFANGILIYIEIHKLSGILLFYPIIFATAYTFGRLAGKEIIDQKRNNYISGLKYGTITAIIITFYFVLVSKMNDGDTSLWMQVSIIILAIATIYWQWIAFAIKRKSIEND